MKTKSAILAIPILAVALLSACKPSGMSDTVYNLGDRAYTIMGDYLSGAIISSSDCEERLQDIDDSLMDYYESVKDDDSSSKDATYALAVEVDVFLYLLDLKDGDEIGLQEQYEELGDILGK